MKGGWVYILTNRPDGVLYVGVAADIAARVHQHREGAGSSFCRRYNLTRLVLAEEYPIDEAIAREKALKEWSAPGRSSSSRRPTRSGTTSGR